MTPEGDGWLKAVGREWINGTTSPREDREGFKGNFPFVNDGNSPVLLVIGMK